MKGTGILGSAYIIENLTDLDNIRNDITAYYELGCDIDATATDDVNWNEGKGWIPIGDAGVNRFTGTLDGKGHIISNLNLIGNFTYNTLFVSNMGIIRNLSLLNITVKQSKYHSYGGTFASFNEGLIQSCYVTGNLTGNVDTLMASIANDNFSGGTIENCYSFANVSGLGAGLVFKNSTNGTITNCYYGGNTSMLPDITMENYGVLTNCYYLENPLNNQEEGTSGVKLTDAGMKDQASFVGLDFDNVWGIDPNINDGYPYLKAFEQPSSDVDITIDVPTANANVVVNIPTINVSTPSSPMQGLGTLASPYIIETLTHLDEVRNDLTAYYELGCDIDATDTANWNGCYGWIPIGNKTNVFNGSFDGKGHVISNLYIYRPTEDYQGLFGVYSGYMSNLGLRDIIITGHDYVGSFYGEADISGLRLFSSFSTGIVTGNSCVGGIVGNIIADMATEIRSSFSKCKVIGNDKVAGFSGCNSGSMMRMCSLNGCYSCGKVTGNTQVGGFTSGTMYAQQLQSYWDIDVSGQTSSTLGYGLTTAEMKIQTSYESWDFEDTWGIDANLNDGYPYLRIFEQPSSDIDITIDIPTASANIATNIPTIIIPSSDVNTTIYTPTASADVVANIPTIDVPKTDVDITIDVPTANTNIITNIPTISISGTNAPVELTSKLDSCMYYENDAWVSNGKIVANGIWDALNFNDLDIPKGATITSAIIKFKSIDVTDIISTTIDIRAGGGYQRFSGNWTENFSAGDWIETPNLKDAIQAIIDADDYVEGRFSMYFSVSSNSQGFFHGTDGTSDDKPQFVIAYEVTSVTIPIIEIIEVTKNKISDEQDFTTSTISFKVNQDILEWEIRATYEGTSEGQGIGLLVGNGGSLLTETSQNFDVDYTELIQGDRKYKMTIYVKDSEGVWY